MAGTINSSDALTEHESYNSAAEGKSSSRERFELWLSDHILDHVSFIIPVLLSFGYWITNDNRINSLPFSEEIKSGIKGNAVLFIFMLLSLSVITYWLQHRKRDRFAIIKSSNATLKTENVQLRDNLSKSVQDMQSLCEGYLFSLAKGPLKFANGSASYERITLYVHDSGDRFIPIARFSFHPDYAKKGRLSYPEREGCIAQTWRKGSHFANDYPDPEKNLDEYYSRCKRDSISDANIKEIGMKSRLYYGYRVSDTQGKRPIAVIIVEATDPNRYTKEALGRIFERERYLSEITERLSPWMPSYKEAKEKGF